MRRRRGDGQSLSAEGGATRTRLAVPDALDDAGLEARLFPRAAPVHDRIRPDCAYIHRELKRNGVTLQLLWEEYAQVHPDGYRRTQFCEIYRQWAGRLRPSMRQVHRAGEKTFIDFSASGRRWSTGARVSCDPWSCSSPCSAPAASPTSRRPRPSSSRAPSPALAATSLTSRSHVLRADAGSPGAVDATPRDLRCSGRRCALRRRAQPARPSFVSPRPTARTPEPALPVYVRTEPARPSAVGMPPGTAVSTSALWTPPPRQEDRCPRNRTNSKSIMPRSRPSSRRPTGRRAPRTRCESVAALSGDRAERREAPRRIPSCRVRALLRSRHPRRTASARWGSSPAS